MEKDKFLKILKKIVDVLESNEITYQIPYCHLDKTDFKYQDIIISDFTDVNVLITELNIYNLRNNNDKISGEIDGVHFNFIKLPIEFITYGMYFYSFNFFPYLINAILKQLSLEWNVYGLFYNIGNKKIFITRNYKDICDFLNIDFAKVYGINVPTKDVLCNCILQSDYYNKDIFSDEIMKNIDPNFEFNREYYTEFRNINYNIQNEIDDEKNIIYIINEYFDCGLIEKLLKIEFEKDFPNLSNVNQIKTDISKNINNIENIKNVVKNKKESQKKIKLKSKDIKYRTEGDTYIFLDDEE